MTDFILTLLALGMGWVWMRTIRPAEVQEPEAQRRLVQEALQGKLEAQSGLRALWCWIALCGSRSQRLQNRLSTSTLLTEAEQELIDLMLQGMSPKDIAHYKGVSSFHVYNLRSRVRRKLNVPKYQGLELFLRAQAREAHSSHE